MFKLKQKMNKLKYIAVLAFLGTVGISELSAQIKEEQLILNRKREPEVKKIEKKKTSVVQEKNYPPDNKKKEDSLNLKYDIVNVPPVSDFKTTEIQGEDISPKFSNDYQSNYFRLGYGNYGKFLADANISGKIQDNVEIGAGTTIDRATMGSTIIRRGVKLDNLIQIAHNVEIGENTVIAALAGVAGSAKIGKNCQIGGQVGISGHITVADNTKIGAQAGIMSSVKSEGEVLLGSPAIDAKEYLRAYAMFKKLHKNQ